MPKPPKVTNNSIKDKEEKQAVFREGHLALRRNAQDFKQELVDQKAFDSFISEIKEKLSKASDLDTQAKWVAVLLEANVENPARIGESLFETFRHDLQVKASGKFEFVTGDKNLAQAILSLIASDEEFAQFIRDLCNCQTTAGVATPFDYRRLTLGFEGDFSTASTNTWKKYFRVTPKVKLEKSLEIGKSFASTKPRRYSDKEEQFLEKHIEKRDHLLDIGGSIGVNAEYLIQKLGFVTATVTDVRTKKELEDAFYGNFEQKEEIDYMFGDQGDIVQTTPNQKEYDLVTANNVLVHIIEKEKALRNILPRVVNGGLLVISGGYNANPPRKRFWVFKKDVKQIELIV